MAGWFWSAGESTERSARPSIRPTPDKPKVSGLGAVKVDNMPASYNEETLICGTCQDDNRAVFGAEDKGEEELVADDEGEQAEKVQSLPSHIS